MDDTPLILSDWSTIDTAITQYITISENGENVYSSNDIYPYMDNALNRNINCSAMITTEAGYPGKWIPIPCDTNITSSFFCVGEDTSLKNVTRPFNWFTDLSNQSDTGKAGITIKYQTNGSSVLFCPPLAILIKNTCFLFAIADRQNNDHYNDTCRDNNAALLRLNFFEYYRSQLANYYDFAINITYLPLYLKEGIQDNLDDYSYYNRLYDFFDMYAMDERLPTKMFFKYEEEYGHPLFARYADKTLAYLLTFISLQFKTYFSNLRSPIIPLITTSIYGRHTCLLLHPDYLKEMAIFHTMSGFSVPGWRLQKINCSSNALVDLIVCTVEPSYREESVCPVDYYECQDRSCILSIYVCDGHLDCNSDEQQIECSQTVTLRTVNCPNSDFWLENNHSISGHSVCDGISQCGDGEDEGFCLYFNTLQNNNPLHTHSILQESKTLSHTDGVGWVLNSTIVLSTRPCTFVRGMYRGISNVDNSHLLHCSHVLCPGMFKCRHSYCIDIVAICDGVVDCPESEDESSCLNIYCPGMIKCRGETKCVPTWNICDGRSDCLLNQDDEATCYKCPEYCKCNSYYIECILRAIIPWKIKNMPMKIMKAILTKDTFDFAFVETYFHLLYLDISMSKTRHLIDNSNKQNQYIPRLFLFNASSNLLSEIYVINQPYFQSIQVIDLSHNRLLHFVSIPSKLKILYLKGNLLVLIWYQNFPNKHNLRFLDLRNNPVRAIHLANILTVMINLRYFRSPDQILCCILPSNVKCSYPKMYCKGLCSLKLVNSLFLSISVITLLLSLGKTILFSVTLSRKNKSDDKYLILMIHVSLSDTVLCIWAVLTCGLFMVASPSDRNLWRLSALCNNLGVASFIALQMRMYIQLYHKLFLFVKVVFPLRKDSIITDSTNKICLLLWLFSVLTSVSLKIILGKVYINGDLCLSLFVKDGMWSIPSLFSLLYWVICCSCVILYLILVLIMCRVIFMSLKTLQDETIVKRRRQSAIRFSLVNISIYGWWMIFSSLMFISHNITVSSLYQDYIISTVILHTAIHLLGTGKVRK